MFYPFFSIKIKIVDLIILFFSDVLTHGTNPQTSSWPLKLFLLSYAVLYM